MREHRIRHLPVLQAGHVVGVVSERDLAWIESLDDTRKESLTVDEAMTPYPYVARPDTSLAEVARTMAAGKFGATLVVEHGQLLGVFTTTDAMRALAEALEPNGARTSTASPKS
jgi:acetoin utilization protein AcuB